MCDAQLTDGTNSLSLSGVSLGRTKFNVSASASSHFLAPLDEAFESIRNGGRNLLTAEMEVKCTEATYKRNFSFHLGLSVAPLTDVARMNLAGRAAWRLSRCSRPACRLQLLLLLLELLLLLLPMLEAAPMQPRLDRPSPPMWFLLPPADEPPDDATLVSLRLKLSRKLECFLSRSMGTIVTNESRLSLDADGQGDDCSSSLEPDVSSGDGWSALVLEQHPGWMPSIQYGSLNPATQRKKLKAFE